MIHFRYLYISPITSLRNLKQKHMNRKSFLFTAAVSTALFLYGGCAAFNQKAGTPAPSNQKTPARFDYSPPVKSAVGSTDLTISLIEPSFVRPGAIHAVAPIPDMTTSMASDFQELLTSKGFKFQGPFENAGAMTFSEQQNTSFCMAVEISLNPDIQEKTTYNAGLNGLIAPTYRTSGDVTFTAKLDIVLSSPHSVKLLVKHISLAEPVVASYVGSLKWEYQQPSFVEELKQDNAVYNAVARALEKIYNKSLDLAWQQLDPEEMKLVARQAKEADKRWN